MPDSLIAIIQARTSSRRLPGKVLLPVAGRPMLELLVERLGRARIPDRIVLATSTEPSDDPLAEFATKRGIALARGPLEDVAGRFATALERFPCRSFIRVNGDSPMLDPALVDRIAAAHREGGADITTNVHPRTFPKGQSVEIVESAIFLREYPAMREPEDREHVTRLFYREAKRFRIVNIASGRDFGGLDLSIDTPEQFANLERIVERLGPRFPEAGLDEIVELSKTR